MTNDGQIPMDGQRLSAVSAQFGLRLVLLFGSAARGQARPDSDCDIAVAGCPPDRFWDLSVALQATIRGGAQLDLVRLEPADPLFRYEILRDAVLLYGDPDLFCEFRAFAFRDFHDSASLFALERTLLRKKLARIKERLRAEA
jgi:predicted nucleotidyltransferase